MAGLGILGSGAGETTKGKLLVNCCILLLVCIAAGGLLVTAANYFPINQKNKDVSLEQIQGEGLFPEVPAMQGGYGSFHSMNPTALELATDSLMLKMALYEGEDRGIVQAFRCYSTQYEDEYSRYWHGYVVILRILLFFFDYYEIRIINGFCQGLLAVLAALYIGKRKGTKYAMAVISSYLLLMPMALAHCLQYSWAFYAAFGALAVYAGHKEYWDKGKRYVYFFLLTGAATIYLDLLTYPLLTWGLPAVWWIILQEGEEGAWDYLKKLVFSGIAWIAGYGGMWIGKWTLGSVILRENLFERAFSEAFLWTVSEGEEAITLRDRLYAVYRNWSTYEYSIYFMILAAWLVYWMIKWVSSRCSGSRKAPALLLAACSSIVWYLVLAGHANMHHIFTHRIFGVSIAAFMGMALLSTDGGEAPGKRRVLGNAALLAGIGIAAFCSMRLIKDHYLVHNGDYDFVQVEADGPVSMTFTPAFSEVLFMYMGFSVDNGVEGCYRMWLLDQDYVVDKIILPFYAYSGGNFHKIDLNWKLKPGHPYTLLLEPVDNDGDVYLWLTAQGREPLSELGGTSLGGEDVPGQMLAGVNYWCGLMGFPGPLFFTVTFMGTGMMVLYACGSMAGKRGRTYGAAYAEEKGIERVG